MRDTVSYPAVAHALVRAASTLVSTPGAADVSPTGQKPADSRLQDIILPHILRLVGSNTQPTGQGPC